MWILKKYVWFLFDNMGRGIDTAFNAIWATCNSLAIHSYVAVNNIYTLIGIMSSHTLIEITNNECTQWFIQISINMHILKGRSLA